ncbi:MAG: hypothetical protein AABY58_04020 [Nitrospirota bacterium]
MAGYLIGLNHTSYIFVKKCDKMDKLLLEKIVIGVIICEKIICFVIPACFWQKSSLVYLWIPAQKRCGNDIQKLMTRRGVK